MQNGATIRTVTRGGVQFVVLAAVAVVGLSVGRWVVPDAPRRASGGAQEAVSAAEELTAAQGSSLDVWAVDGPAVVDPSIYARSTSDQSLIERKLSQLDRLDARVIPGPVVVNPAIYAPTSVNSSFIERKFAQMDALDSRAAEAGSTAIIVRKFAQMDAEDAR